MYDWYSFDVRPIDAVNVVGQLIIIIHIPYSSSLFWLTSCGSRSNVRYACKFTFLNEFYRDILVAIREARVKATRKMWHRKHHLYATFCLSTNMYTNCWQLHARSSTKFHGYSIATNNTRSRTFWGRWELHSDRMRIETCELCTLGPLVKYYAYCIVVCIHRAVSTYNWIRHFAMFIQFESVTDGFDVSITTTATRDPSHALSVALREIFRTLVDGVLPISNCKPPAPRKLQSYILTWTTVIFQKVGKRDRLQMWIFSRVLLSSVDCVHAASSSIATLSI